jgi:hypothetical protein
VKFLIKLSREDPNPSLRFARSATALPMSEPPLCVAVLAWNILKTSLKFLAFSVRKRYGLLAMSSRIGS